MSKKLDALFSGKNRRQSWPSPGKTERMDASSTALNANDAIEANGSSDAVIDPTGFRLDAFAQVINELSEALSEMHLGTLEPSINHLVTELKSWALADDTSAMSTGDVSEKLKLLDEVLTVHFASRR